MQICVFQFHSGFGFLTNITLPWRVPTHTPPKRNKRVESLHLRVDNMECVAWVGLATNSIIVALDKGIVGGGGGMIGLILENRTIVPDMGNW